MLPGLVICTLIFAAAAAEAPPVAPPAMYVFGDSLFDAGNNNFLPTFARANYLPYGSDFPGGPTGRFTNGRTVVDFLAEFMGLPYPPPFLQGIVQTQPTGVNYASASCGILFETGKNLGQCVSMGEQINWFQVTIGIDLMKFFHTRERMLNHLSTSLFAISIGSNDYLVNYLQSPTAGLIPTPEVFAAQLITVLSQHLQRLYLLGARRILLFELGPLGCIPSITRKNNLRRGKCVEQVNNYALIYNKQLAVMIQEFSTLRPDFMLIHGRIFLLAYGGIKYPSSFGLGDSSTACCTTWANGTSACIPAMQPCANTSLSYFWDGFHLTEAVYRGVAEKCFNDSSICWPRSISEFMN